MIDLDVAAVFKALGLETLEARDRFILLGRDWSPQAIDWSTEMVREWRKTGMFSGDGDAPAKADRVVSELADHALTKSHARHISSTRGQEVGLKIRALEEAQALQEAVLSPSFKASPGLSLHSSWMNLRTRDSRWRRYRKTWRSPWKPSRIAIEQSA